MPLRSPNILGDDLTLIQAMRVVLVGYPTPNTQLAAGSADGTGLSATDNRVYIRDKAALAAGSFPAVNLRAGTQHRRRNSRSTYTGTITLIADYYDRWTTTPETQAQVRANIALDLERMAANLESNDTLTLGASLYVVTLEDLSLSDDNGIFDDQLLQGERAIYRSLTAIYCVLPYDV